MAFDRRAKTIIQGSLKIKPQSRIIIKMALKTVIETRFFINFDFFESAQVYYVCIKNPMCDLICDVASFCV